MARPIKRGLNYFPLDVDVFSDPKTLRLANKYGSNGLLIYISLLCIIYRECHFIEAEVSDLALLINRNIGNPQLPEIEEIIEIVKYLGEIGLLDKGLMEQNIFTSKGIQQRYLQAKKKSNDEFLLHKLTETDSYCNNNSQKPPTNAIVVAETPANDEFLSQQVHKEKKRKVKESKGKKTKEENGSIPREIKTEFSEFSKMRTKIKKPLTERATSLIIAKLQELAPDDYEKQKRILEQSTLHCWQSVYPLNGEQKREKASYDLEEFKSKTVAEPIVYTKRSGNTENVEKNGVK